MATKSKLELAVDAGKWEDGLKKAQKALNNFTESQGGFKEAVNKSETYMKKFVSMMGKIESSASSSRGKIRDYKNLIDQLTIQFNELGEAQKKGEIGKAMLDSIEKLKDKAAECQDRMADLNEELRHRASDTAFTDSVNMMTRTVGSCASAITAWTGEGKEMEQVIKELAKIQTTVAAVEALTKAFQKQNLVLMKNPYALAVAGIVAVATAVNKLTEALDSQTRAQKLLNEISDKAYEKYAKEEVHIKRLYETANDYNQSLENRIDALNEIKRLVPDYHASLSAEGTLIDNNTEALGRYIDKLKEAARIQAIEDEMVEALKEKREAERALKEVGDSHFNVMGVDVAGLYTGAKTSAAQIKLAQANEKIAMLESEMKVQSPTTKNSPLGNIPSAGAMSSVITAGAEAVDVKPNKPAGTPRGGSSSFTSTLQLPDTYNPVNLASQYVQDYLAKEAANNARLRRQDSELGLKDGTSKAIEEMVKGWNEQIQAADLEPLEISIDDSELDRYRKAVEAVNKEEKRENNLSKINSAASGLSSSFASASKAADAFFGKTKEGAQAAAALSFAATVASLMASFADKMKNNATIWEWIAGGLAGAAALGTIVMQMKSAKSQAFADGGIVKGSSYVGDRVPVMANAGEVILNYAQQENLAGNLQRSESEQQTPYVLGQNIFLGLNNFLKSNGQGQLVTTKML